MFTGMTGKIQKTHGPVAFGNIHTLEMLTKHNFGNHKPNLKTPNLARLFKSRYEPFSAAAYVYLCNYCCGAYPVGTEGYIGCFRYFEKYTRCSVKLFMFECENK